MILFVMFKPLCSLLMMVNSNDVYDSEHELITDNTNEIIRVVCWSGTNALH